MNHTDPRYALWLRIREILLGSLPEWFVRAFPVTVRCSTIAEQVVEAIGPGDPPAAQLARLRRRLARLEYRSARLVCYKPGAGMGSALADELRAELLRFEEATACPFCEDCEVLT